MNTHQWKVDLNTVTVEARYQPTPDGTLRWARALSILARVRRRVAEQHKEGGDL